MIRIVICDDIKYLCDYFKEEMDEQEDFEVVGVAYNRDDCYKVVEKTKPDILILDIQMDSDDTGIEMIKYIKEISPMTKIVLFTIHEDNEYIYKGYSSGISEYIIKTAPKEEIFESIRNVYKNSDVNIKSSYAQIIINECEKVKQRQQSLIYVITLLSKLSNSEMEVLKDLYIGKTYSEIARKRSVEELTVRSQASNILKKFNCNKMRTLVDDLKNMNALAIFDAISNDELTE